MQVPRRPEEGVGAPSLGVIGMENHPSWLQRTELGSSGSPGPARTSETSLQPLSSLDFSATPASLKTCSGLPGEMLFCTTGDASSGFYMPR